MTVISQYHDIGERVGVKAISSCHFVIVYSVYVVRIPFNLIFTI